MAKHLTEHDVQLFVGLLDGWEGKLTWDSLCDAGGKLIGSRPTRQTLNAHAVIKTAFNDKKQLLKSGFTPLKRPQSLAMAEQRIRRLEGENQRLQAENARLIEKFVRWQYNAQKRGISEDVLESPLPVIHRDSAEKKH